MVERGDFLVVDAAGWALGALVLIFVAELFLAMVTMNHVIYFFRSLLPGHGPLPELAGSFCAKIVILWTGLLIGIGWLSLVFYRDYREKSDFIWGPWAQYDLNELMSIILGYQYVAAVFFPLILGFCGLAVWLYMYVYSRGVQA
jgi:hypothetical protein